MLKNYISKLVCFATLGAFFLQPQWFESFSASKTQQNQELNFTKANKLSSYVFDQDDEDESDKDSPFIAADLPPKTTLPASVHLENSNSAAGFQPKDLHRLQERPIWLTCRKIIL